MPDINSDNTRRDYLLSLFRAGQIIELHTPLHCYWDARVNIMDPSYVIAARTERFRITRVGKRGDDVRLTLRDGQAMDGGFTAPGCAILVSHWLDFGPEGHKWRRSIKIVEE